MSTSNRGRTIAATAQRLLRFSRSGHWILAYHLVGAGTGAAVDMSVPQFREHLDVLTRPDIRVVPLDEVVTSQHIRGQALVALTFDDAFANFAEVVWPLLQERSLPATLYVPTGFIDGDIPSPLLGAENEAACSWKTLRRLANEGVDLGSHSHSHRDFPRLSPHERQHELRHSRTRLRDGAGVTPRSFCYPRAHWDRQSLTDVRSVYAHAVVGGGRRLRPGSDPARLPRLPLRTDTSTEDLALALTHGFWLPEMLADGVRQWRGRR